MQIDSSPRNRICKKCGNTFQARWPAEKRLYCSRACSDKAQRVPSAKFIDKICPYCRKAFRQPNWKGRDVTCCSVRCAKRQQAKTVVGENHHLWKPRAIKECVICGKTCEVKPSLADRFRVCSRQCLGIYSNRFQRRVSSLEDTMAELFADAGLAFKRQYKVGRYKADFAFVDAMLIVECDGSYWHSRPEIQASDVRKDAWLAMHGWRVLRLDEPEIKACPGACTEQVLHALDAALPLVA